MSMHPRRTSSSVGNPVSLLLPWSGFRASATTSREQNVLSSMDSRARHLALLVTLVFFVRLACASESGDNTGNGSSTFTASIERRSVPLLLRPPELPAQSVARGGGMCSARNACGRGETPQRGLVRDQTLAKKHEGHSGYAIDSGSRHSGRSPVPSPIRRSPTIARRSCFDDPYR